MKMKAALVILVIIAGYLVGFLFSPVGYKYSSSDRGFEDSEVPFKGRELDTVEWLFEKYKEENNLHDSTLCRKFGIRWWEYWHWYDYFTKDRWDVPKCTDT